MHGPTLSGRTPYEKTRCVIIADHAVPSAIPRLHPPTPRCLFAPLAAPVLPQTLATGLGEATARARARPAGIGARKTKTRRGRSESMDDGYSSFGVRWLVRRHASSRVHAMIPGCQKETSYDRC